MPPRIGREVAADVLLVVDDEHVGHGGDSGVAGSSIVKRLPRPTSLSR
jgi:hypothetical protein